MTAQAARKPRDPWYGVLFYLTSLTLGFLPALQMAFGLAAVIFGSKDPNAGWAVLLLKVSIPVFVVIMIPGIAGAVVWCFGHPSAWRVHLTGIGMVLGTVLGMILAMAAGIG